MKNNTFKINVGDLLQSGGNTDSIQFKNETIKDIPGLSSHGIKGDVILQSFNKDSLLVTLQNISTKIHENCDTCLSNYTRTVNIDKYTAKFQKHIDPNDTTEDEIFPIDGNENIDIQDMLREAIILQEPFVKRCKTCNNKISHTTNEDEFNTYLEGTGNIIFHQKT